MILRRYAVAFALRPLLVALIGLEIVAAPTTGSLTRAVGPEPASVTHGPMLGHPTANSMKVWARTSMPAEWVVRYGRNPLKLDQTSQVVTTGYEHDHAAFVELTELEPDTVYHYRVYIDGLPQVLPGTFRTLPSAQQSRNAAHNPRGLFNFRFQIGSCANQNPQDGVGHHLPTYNTMLRDWSDRISFHIMNGDWLYEEQRNFPVEAWRAQRRLSEITEPVIVGIAPSIVGVWENYRLYLGRAPNLAEWHRNVPSFFTFDDHELLNDIAGTGTAGHRHRRTAFRDIGVRAWHDYLGWANPMAHHAGAHFGKARLESGSDLLRDNAVDFTRLPLDQMSNLIVHWGTPTAGVHDNRLDDDSGDPNSRVYDIVDVVDKHTLRITPSATATGLSSYAIGRRNYGSFRVSNCEFYLLDTRSHREMHNVRQRDRPGLSMLGRHQREWLMSSMRNSDAEFFFVISSVSMMIPHVGSGGSENPEENKDEAWTVFLDERERLINFWSSLNSPVMVMTGDLHNSFAIRVTDNVWEFCAGPHNSVNHVPLSDEGDRPITGRYRFGPRECDIMWSSYVLPDIPRKHRKFPLFCVVQVNNVFDNPREAGTGERRWVAYPQPQVLIQYFDGFTGDLRYAHAVRSNTEPPVRIVE